MSALPLRQLLAFFVAILFILPSCAGAAPKQRDFGNAANKPNTANTTTPQSFDYESLKKFSEILNVIETTYVDQKSRKEVVDGALKGMLESLDPHSTYLTPAEFKDLSESNSGEFVGIGIEMSMENGQLTVISPIEDTPADKAGLKSGDIILAVDGKPTQEMTTQEAVSHIRGQKGSTVKLMILPKGGSAPKEMKIVRDTIPLISIKTREMEPGYYWIRITRFIGHTTDELSTALRQIYKKGDVKGIVLDMRNNPGGLFDEAVNVSNMFISEGDIVSMKGRVPQANKVVKAAPQAKVITAPLVVLINSGSASAAEIVAGALKDNNRAVLVGERTFGKASVQNVIPLPDGSGIKITFARYYTPNGTSIQAEGISPDIEVPFEAVPEKDPNAISWKLREQDLSHHLAGKGNSTGIHSTGRDSIGKNSAGSNSTSRVIVDKDAEKALDQDNQLRVALQIVKALPRLRIIAK